MVIMAMTKIMLVGHSDDNGDDNDNNMQANQPLIGVLSYSPLEEQDIETNDNQS